MIFNFILPFFTTSPGGGTKIMYEYATRLADKGHTVRVYHSLSTPYTIYPRNRPFWVRKLISLVKYKNNARCSWFNFNDKVELKFADCIDDTCIEDADVTISTWWSLVQPLSKLSNKKGVKINLIQDYEIWEDNVDLVQQSYTFVNVRHVVISSYIKNIVKKYNQVVHYVPNSIDYSIYKSYQKISNRLPLTFCMLYSKEARKASDVGIKAFKILKEKYDDLQLVLFGVCERPEGLPIWIKYYKKPDNLVEIYNNSRYFITNSLIEGWGLPAHEAMACGCILICTKIEGHKQFYEHFDGAFNYTPNSVEDLIKIIDHVICLDQSVLDDFSKKNMLIKNEYNWVNAINQLINIVNNNE